METEGRILDPEHPAVKFYTKRYHVEFIGEDASVWVRFHIDQCGSIKALFEDDYQKLFQPNAYFINITDNPEQLKNFKIKEVRVTEVEKDEVKCKKKYQAVFIATNGLEWVKFYIDEHGRIWARFTEKYEDLFNINIEVENITNHTEALETGFKIREVEVIVK
jgi:hypothetical protein